MTSAERERPALWADPAYRVFLAVQTLSALGDSFSYVAIPLLVLHTTGSVVQMGAVTALAGVASVLSGLFAGVIADRVDRGRLLVAADTARCLLFVLLPLVWMFTTPVWLIYVVVPVAEVFSMLFQVTYVTVVPALVPAEEITRANGHLYASAAVAGAIGPALAGLVASAAGPTAAIGIDAATFAVSALGIRFVRFGGTARPPAAERGRVRGEFMTGVRFLWAHPVLRPLTVLLTLLTFLTSGLPDLVVYLVKHELGRPDATVGYVLAVGTLGTFAAASVVSRLRGRLGFGVSWICAFSVAGLAVACLGVSRTVPVVAALVAVHLLCTGIAGICSMSLRQEVTPGHLLGRVTSSFWTVQSALGPLGAAATTAAAAGLGVTTVCLFTGVAVLLVALTGSVTGILRPDTGGPRLEETA
ncbi:MFS transporter [Streptomyces sp. NPDC001348]